MSRRLTPAELAALVDRHVRCSTRDAEEFLRYWQKRGIVEEQAGTFRLSAIGAAMFGGWASDDAGDAAS